MTLANWLLLGILVVVFLDARLWERWTLYIRARRTVRKWGARQVQRVKNYFIIRKRKRAQRGQ